MGSNQDIFIDVRIIASTNRDLKKEMIEKRFREDLYYRLNVIVATIPPLRDRKEDIPILADHFLSIFRDTEGNCKHLSSKALGCLKAYDWHGNVRELRNILERAVILSPTIEIQITDLPAEIGMQNRSSSGPHFEPMQTLNQIESKYIQHIMNETGANRQKASEILGIDPKTLYRKLKEINQA